jgi:electron transport complex protein RnfB
MGGSEKSQMKSVVTALLFITALCTFLGITLHLISRFFKNTDNQLVDQIDALLPQTQCGQCEFPGCRPYAMAIADNKADINQCPPGGEATVQKLAELLNREIKSLAKPETPKQVAVIDEENCIGCVKCIPACPVDAIIGARGQMHTIIPDLCTGCELCIAPCPMDCIELVEVDQLAPWRSGLIKKLS